MDIAGLLLEHGAIVDSCSIVSREAEVLLTRVCVCNLISLLFNANVSHVDFRTAARRSSSRASTVIWMSWRV